MTNAGRELADLELKKPGGHLKTLSLLKMITQGEGTIAEQKEALLTIRISFSKVLPNQIRTPQATSATTHDLDLEFLKSLEAAKQKNLYDH